MRGTHTPFAEFQERYYPQFDLLWSKSFIWGFAHINLDNQAEQLNVAFFTTPRNGSGKLVEEANFSFERR